MKKIVMVILVDKRIEDALKVQGVLTEFGCIIKTRLGVHDGVGDTCSNTGLIILELVQQGTEHKKLEKKLNSIKGVSTKQIEIKLK
jgi:hypothetical protein